MLRQLAFDLLGMIVRFLAETRHSRLACHALLMLLS
jgi:hypothetical protein